MIRAGIGLARLVTLVGAGEIGAREPVPGAMPGDSIYQLTGAFQDQEGRAVRLDVHRGHPVLISMFFASCTDACPLLIAELLRVEASLPPKLRADARVVLVSFDPVHDTPPVLLRLAETHRLDTGRWRLLTGADDAVREVAAVLGVKFRRLSSGAFNHSSVIAVLDRRGAVVSRIDGITPGDPKTVARVTAALERAAAGASAPRAPLGTLGRGRSHPDRMASRP
jgi:protein SCO1/2